MQLKPDQVLMITILAVYVLSQQSWSAKVPPTGLGNIGSLDHSTWIVYARPPSGVDQLEAGHLILALHQVVFTKARNPDGYGGVRARLMLRDKPIGIIDFTTERPPRELSSRHGGSATLNTSSKVSASSVSDFGPGNRSRGPEFHDGVAV